MFGTVRRVIARCMFGTTCGSVPPRPGLAAGHAGTAGRALLVLAAGLIAWLATPAAAQAACTVTTGSTTGATITIDGTGSGNTVSLCVSDSTVLWGLYGASNGANPGIDAFNNYPMTAGGLSATPLTVTTAKASYTITPQPDGTFSSFPQYDIVMNSVSGSGTDTITLWYASACNISNTCGFAPQFTDTSFTITVNLPALPPTISAAFSPTSIGTGGSSTLTLTIGNPNPSTALTGVAVAASALPSGLTGSSPATACSGGTATFNAGSLSLSGASIAASGSCTVTLTVTGTTAGSYSYTTGAVSASGPSALTGSTATTPTQLSVTGPTATQAIASKALTQNQATASFTPVTGSGGTAPLTYGIAPSLPAGLSFDTGSGAISGTPTATLAATTFTVTVTDANSAAASNTFSLTVNSAVTATQSVPTVTLTQNHAATAFTPVTGGGGTAPLTYGIAPSLPSGLSLNTANGQITGTPTATLTATTFTVTVTDANSATASNTFSLTVNGAVTAVQSIASVTLTQNHTATAFTPVTGGGGTAPLGYAVAPLLPAGLSLSPTTGAISGTPTASSGATVYTVTVTDTNGATASATFSLTVNGVVTATQAVASTTLTAGQAATAFTPVTGGGGTAPLGYAVAPTLPTGLSLNIANGQITGTPTASSGAAVYTVTVTDANGATASNTFSLAVNGALTATQAVASKALTQNTAATAFTPVTGAGGTPPLGYAVAPALPTGLSMSPTTGAVTGTPTVTSGATTYTVTITDANSAIASNTFSLTVNAAVTATQAVASKTLTANAAATPFTPVTGGGGTAPLSYGVSPALPSGLIFDTSSGAISGTPSTALTATTFTVTVTDANSATASNTFSLTVNGAVTATQAVASKTLTVNTATASFTPVTGAGGTAPLSYGVSPGVPAGLSFDTTTGAVTGTPTAISAATTYTVTVTDANSASATATFSLAVNGAVTATQAIAAKTLTQGAAVTAFTPVTGGGGTSPLGYAVAPALPAGLAFDPASGAVTGTPTATLAATTFTVTVTDANSATASSTFSLTINSAVTATTAVAATTLTAGQAATPFTPVTGSGGTAPLSYGVSPGLPAGLSLNPANGQVSGTPTAPIATTTFTVTVTDANNATATATFGLTVNGAVVATTAIPTTALIINQAATPFTPVTGSGGTGALAYAVAPGLPTGLAFNTATGQITGTPTAPQPPATFTVTVTDTNSASASATFSLSVGQAATSTSLISSKNPSEAGQPVTFTATVSGPAGTPTGTVTFNDGGVAIGTATLAGGTAALTTTGLKIGKHTITAVYSGSAVYAASTSAALVQDIGTPQDSLRLRAMQIVATRTIAQNSGAAITGAIDSAIAEGFSGGGALISPSGMGLRFNFAAEPDDDESGTGARGPDARAASAYVSTAPQGGRAAATGRSRIDDAFAAIDRGAMPAKAARRAAPKDWLMWAEIRGTGVGSLNQSSATPSPLSGTQVNALMGLTRRLTPDLLVGVVGGWETFDYRSETLNSRLKGDGWTAGSYLGWRFAAGLRFDAAVAYTGLGYDGASGAAAGGFDGRRWLVSGGLTGSTQAWGLAIEPSAKIYGLWERQDAYTDTLGTPQAERTFFTGRASAGVKAAWPWLVSPELTLAPYAGLYADYYFTKDDAEAVALEGAPALASVPLLDGWSARATGGLSARFGNGAAVSVGAELGGLGGDTQIWSFRGRAAVPF
ncbi:putative Ig domain-containing protein [Rhodoplanes sp. TEM]|uniref:Ig domain-containing protein n=1 Tax=Rhodoplanes tepidamans TaxID=200616 RepID=A0ABT5JD91_RHOTP|nr:MULTISPECIES: putative Ig domain-containing protein [Rhodoplanes]MDC7787478.1 putative Ig domain-containing protein [Rhodoplanes tepidamans]MDC7983931.1 putative Ig domain-containing protein [Rhodoplanes sp. TEM]MDQ0354370.1 hypothetical protein [Rhodoplanes tepidamans]